MAAHNLLILMSDNEPVPVPNNSVDSSSASLEQDIAAFDALLTRLRGAHPLAKDVYDESYDTQRTESLPIRDGTAIFSVLPEERAFKIHPSRNPNLLENPDIVEEGLFWDPRSKTFEVRVKIIGESTLPYKGSDAVGKAIKLIEIIEDPQQLNNGT